jgi:cellulase/cellobiase CelA1
MVIVETDKLTTIRCLPRWARARRFRELSFEVRLMHRRNPKAIVYIDAGAADWGKNAATIARWLRRADVAQAQGFALNASHFDWTSKEVSSGCGSRAAWAASISSSTPTSTGGVRTRGARFPPTTTKAARRRAEGLASCPR